MMADLDAKQGDKKTLRINAKYLNAQRTTTNLGLEEGVWTPDWPAKSGMATKLHAICDSQESSLNLFATAGQASACSGARAMIHSLPKHDWQLGDCGYDADWFHETLRDKGIRAFTLGRKQRKKQVKADKAINNAAARSGSNSAS